MHYYIRHIEAHTEKEGKEMNAWPLGHFACLSMWILRPIQPKIYLFFWRGNTFVLHLCWPAIFYFLVWITFFRWGSISYLVGIFHFSIKTPVLKDERHNILEVINGVCLGTVVSLALKKSCLTRSLDLKLDNGLWLIINKQNGLLRTSFSPLYEWFSLALTAWPLSSSTSSTSPVWKGRLVTPCKRTARTAWASATMAMRSLTGGTRRAREGRRSEIKTAG